MQHRDTSIALKQAINQALNATEGLKPSYQTIALNRSIPNIEV